MVALPVPGQSGGRPAWLGVALVPVAALGLGVALSAAVLADPGHRDSVAVAAIVALIAGMGFAALVTRHAAASLAFCGTLLLTLWLCSPAERLLFVSDRDTPGRPQIYVVDPGGGSADRLTATAGEDAGPVASPDGRRIAFSRRLDGREQLVLARPDGTGATPLAGDAGNSHHPAWSPDGRLLAFASDRNGDWDIFVIALDGTGLRAVAHHPAREDWPAWSPDGRYLAFESDRDGRTRLFLANTDGSRVEALDGGVVAERQPAWSPDGRALAFIRGDVATGAAELCVVPLAPAAGDARCLTGPGRYAAPAWSPAGTRLAFAAGRGAGWDVLVIPAAGGTPRDASRHTGLNTAPAWASSGPASPLRRWLVRAVRRA